MKGLQVAVDAVDPDARADALVRDLELAALRKKLRREDEVTSTTSVQQSSGHINTGRFLERFSPLAR